MGGPKQYLVYLIMCIIFSPFNHAGSRFIGIISNPKQSRVYMLFEKATPVVDSKASPLAPVSSNKVTNDE